MRLKKGLKDFGQKMSSLFTKLVLGDSKAPMEIGAPYNVQHVQHVQADPHTSTGFTVSAMIFADIYTLIYVVSFDSGITTKNAGCSQSLWNH